MKKILLLAIGASLWCMSAGAMNQPANNGQGVNTQNVHDWSFDFYWQNNHLHPVEAFNRMINYWSQLLNNRSITPQQFMANLTLLERWCQQAFNSIVQRTDDCENALNSEDRPDLDNELSALNNIRWRIGQARNNLVLNEQFNALRQQFVNLRAQLADHNGPQGFIDLNAALNPRPSGH